jgi:hypothetical protein
MDGVVPPLSMMQSAMHVHPQRELERCDRPTACRHCPAASRDRDRRQSATANNGIEVRQRPRGQDRLLALALVEQFLDALTRRYEHCTPRNQIRLVRERAMATARTEETGHRRLRPQRTVESGWPPCGTPWLNDVLAGTSNPASDRFFRSLPIDQTDEFSFCTPKFESDVPG